MDFLTYVLGGTALDILAKDFRTALENSDVRAIILDFDSPGGIAVGPAEMADMIFNARGNKPIISYVGRNCCSAAYWLASAADTLGALKRALEAFEFDHVTIEEWFDYGGDPYTFRVFIEVVTEGFDINDLTEVQAVINQTKNVRSHLEMLRAFLCTTSETPRLGSAFSTGEITTIYGLEVFEI